MRYAWGFLALVITIPAFAFAQSTCSSMSYGSSGTNVVALQKFLGTAYTDFPSPTGFFGRLTEAAVKQWQEEQGIVSSGTAQTTGWGVAGPRTLAAMKLCVPAMSAGQTIVPPKSTSMSDAASIQALIQSLLAQIELLKKQLASPATTSPITTYAERVGVGITQSSSQSSCPWSGQTLANGSSLVAYQAPSVANGSTCISQTRTCTNGVLSGSYQYLSCAVGPGASCMFDGLPVSHGDMRFAFEVSSVPYGSSCLARSQWRACQNGTLSGSYQYSTCTIAPPLSCSFNGLNILHGASRIAYETQSVPYGSTCISQTRTCTDGVLSGSYSYPSCTVGVGASCAFDGQTIASGSSVAAFTSAVVASGNSCVSQTRTCINGVLSGNGAYTHKSCSVQSPNAPLPNTFVPLTYNGVGIQLHGWFAKPAGSGPYPVVILAHGCSGVDPNDPASQWSHVNQWASLMRDWGYATLIVDSFTARGVTGGICSNSDFVGTRDRAADLYSAAAVLAKMPDVNPVKIGIFGISHGGDAVSSTVRVDSSNGIAAAALAAAGGRIGAGAALYPICDSALSGSFYSPFFVAIGSADDWSSPLKCETLTNFPAVSATPVDISSFGALVRVIVYPDVTHAFDMPGSTTLHFNSLGYRIAYDPAATADVQARIKTFFDSYLR